MYNAINGCNTFSFPEAGDDGLQPADRTKVRRDPPHGPGAEPWHRLPAQHHRRVSAMLPRQVRIFFLCESSLIVSTTPKLVPDNILRWAARYQKKEKKTIRQTKKMIKIWISPFNDQIVTYKFTFQAVCVCVAGWTALPSCAALPSGSPSSSTSAKFDAVGPWTPTRSSREPSTSPSTRPTCTAAPRSSPTRRTPSSPPSSPRPASSGNAIGSVHIHFPANHTSLSLANYQQSCLNCVVYLRWLTKIRVA